MNKQLIQSVKGFKDYLPAESLKRRFVLGKIIEVFNKFGFDPLETPTLEYAEILEGKYGEEEKLIYKFETPGGDKVALKYDQTVPLARVIAQYGPKGEQKLPMPFKRYQIQSAYRGENTQKGRYREFMQCDADIVGARSELADAEILSVVYEIYQALGLDVIIKINDRALLSAISWEALPALDKLNKIGEEGVIKELQGRGFSLEKANSILNEARSLEESARLLKIKELYQNMGYPLESIITDKLLVRGLDYYTGLIIEVVLKSNPNSSSLGGGGRYDDLIEKFIGENIPAVGFSVGLDRTIEAMEEVRLITEEKTQTKVLVTVTNEQINDALEVTKKLRDKNISTQIWLEPNIDLEKQLKYSEKLGINYVVRFEGKEPKVKDYGANASLTLDELLQKLSS